MQTENLEQLLASNFVTEPTRRILRERIADGERDYQPQFFDADEFKILCAVCEAFAPTTVVSCNFAAGEVDKRLTQNKGNGWRYNEMPPDGAAHQSGLKNLDETARQKHQNGFAALTLDQRREILQLLKDGEADENVWQNLSPTRFIEEFLAEFAENFYSHPLVQNEIDYIGFADKKGFKTADFGFRISDLKDAVLMNEDDAKLNNKQQINLTNPQSAIRNPQAVDAVVIGTGAGGAPILARLAAAGLNVVALEAGQSFDYKQFATDERAQTDIFWSDERLSAGRDAVAFGNNNSGCGVGGSTIHFTAYTPRAHADDFQLFSEFGVGRDWVLPFAEIEKYYPEIEYFLGVSGNSNYPWGTRDYPLPPLPLNGAAELMQKACRSLNIQTSPAPNAALSQNYFRDGLGWRPRCTNRGFCQAGCSVGAKSSMDTTYLPFAVKNGAEIRAECFVTNFEFDANGKINAVVYVQNGETKKQLCKNVFLCAGAVETPRLLLINDLANSSGQVGKNFMAHPGGQVWGVFDEPVYPHKGIPGGLISEDTHRPQNKFNADFAGGYLLQSIGVMPVTYASQLTRGEKCFGAELDEWMQQYNHTAGINILGDCLPHADNFLELSDEKDVRGLPKPRIYFNAGDNEKRMTVHAEKLMREIWSAAGAKKMWSFARHAHTIGTCVMGANADDAVVNADCQSFDIANLYICDNSVFPSALSVNPSLTIIALALRTADKFLKSHK